MAELKADIQKALTENAVPYELTSGHEVLGCSVSALAALLNAMGWRKLHPIEPLIRAHGFRVALAERILLAERRKSGRPVMIVVLNPPPAPMQLS